MSNKNAHNAAANKQLIKSAAHASSQAVAVQIRDLTKQVAKLGVAATSRKSRAQLRTELGAIPVPRGIRAANDSDAGVAYLMCLLDPWHHMAHIPQRVAGGSALFTTKNTNNVTPTILGIKPFDGSLVALVPGNLSQNYASSSSAPEFGPSNTYVASITGGVTLADFPVQAPVAPRCLLPQTAGPLNGTYALTQFDVTPQVNAIRNAFTAVRPVAKAVRVEYIGAPIDAAGQFVAGFVPGSYSIPSLITPSASVPGQMSYDSNQTLIFDDIQTLEGAQLFGALDGFHATWCPTGDEIDVWRPTKYTPPLAAEFAGSGYLGVDGAPICDGDAGQFRATADRLLSINDMRIYGGYGNAATEAAVATFNQVAMQQLRSPADPMFVVAGQGLPNDAQIMIEWITVWEGISDTRNWSLTQHTHAVPAPAEHVALARTIAAAMPQIHAGSHHDAFFNKVSTIAQKAFSFGKRAIEAGRSIAPHASHFLESIGMGAEAAFLARLGTAGTVAELGALLV